jgi:hypothetical protein
MVPIAAAVLLPALALTLTSSPVSASPITTPVHWFVKGQDMAGWCNQSSVDGGGSLAQCPTPTPPGDLQGIGITARAQQDVLTLPAITWTGCGVWQRVTYGHSDYTSCETWGSNGTLITEDYNRLAAALKTGYRGTAMYDLESWNFTPLTQQQNPVAYLVKAAKLAKSYGVNLIETTGGKLNTLQNDEVAVSSGAAAFIVSFQSQGWPTSTWNSRVSSWVSALRKARRRAHTSTLIMAGLGTNTPTVHPTSVLMGQYNELTRFVGISAIWMNANVWRVGSDQCAARTGSGGPGCPEYAVQVLHNSIPDTLLP